MAEGKKKKAPEELLRSLVDKENEILKTEEALVESMRRFRDLFEQSPIGIGLYSPKGDILIVNNAYFNVYEISSFKDISSQNLFTDIGLTEERKTDVRAGKVVSFEKKVTLEASEDVPQQAPKYLLLTISPLLSGDDVIGYTCQVQDITENKRIAESQRLAQLGRLLSDMAHEVNNPLMIISGRAELALLEGVEDGPLKDTLEIILDQCFTSKEIIQSLLKYSRVGKVEKGQVDVSKALELITNILQHHFHTSNIILENNIQKDLPKILGNEKQLQEVLMNIIRNSADAMPSGGLIKVDATSDRGHLYIKIKDTGEGMSEKVLKRIFEPFFTTKHQGTGLGLAVCHTIIQDHGGVLKYESVQGEGTTAKIILPINA